MRKNEKLLERILKSLVEELIKDGSIEEFELTPLHSLLTEFSLPAGAYQRIRKSLTPSTVAVPNKGGLEFPRLFQVLFDQLNPFHHVSEIDEAFKRLVKIFNLPENFLREYEEQIYGISSDEGVFDEAFQIDSSSAQSRGTTSRKYEIARKEESSLLIANLLGDGIRAEPGAVFLSAGSIHLEPTCLEVLKTLRGMNVGRSLHRPAYRGHGQVFFRPIHGELVEWNLENEEFILNPDVFIACDIELQLSALRAVKMPSEETPQLTKIFGSGVLIMRATSGLRVFETKGEPLTIQHEAFLGRTRDFKHQVQFSREPGQGSRMVHILQGTGTILYTEPSPL